MVSYPPLLLSGSISWSHLPASIQLIGYINKDRLLIQRNMYPTPFLCHVPHFLPSGPGSLGPLLSYFIFPRVAEKKPRY